MWQTLYVIPHALLGTPLLIGWLALGAVAIVVTAWRRGWRDALGGPGLLVVVGAAVIRFVLPWVEVPGLDPTNPDGPLVPAGLAIRGYGLMLMLGILAGIALAVVRARQIGISADRTVSLCIGLLIGGLIGARLFYVIQKWETFAGYSGGELAQKLIDLTEGGLVVYGGLFGAVAAWLVFCAWHKLSVWKTADLIAPGMLIGLAVGRMGCLLNGCCFGGPCEIPHLGLSFPAGSAPYLRQVETGELLGIRFDAEDSSESARRSPRRVSRVEPGSPAAEQGVAVGDRLTLIAFPEDLWFRAILQNKIDVTRPERSHVVIDRLDQNDVWIPIRQLPAASQPVHATQIYASINALLLTLVLWFYYPFRRNDGELLAWMLILYPVARFLEESIRVDELGQFGTPWSISQWVSLLVLPVGIGLLVWRRSFPAAKGGYRPQTPRRPVGPAADVGESG